MTEVKRKSLRRKKPFWKRFRKPSEENYHKLPKQRPPCHNERPHIFEIVEGTGSFTTGRCRRCGLRWIFKTWLEPETSWGNKKNKNKTGNKAGNKTGKGKLP